MEVRGVPCGLDLGGDHRSGGGEDQVRQPWTAF